MKERQSAVSSLLSSRLPADSTCSRTQSYAYKHTYTHRQAANSKYMRLVLSSDLSACLDSATRHSAQRAVPYWSPPNTADAMISYDNGSSMCVQLAGGCYTLLYTHTYHKQKLAMCMHAQQRSAEYVYPATCAAAATVRSEQTRSVVCRKSPYAVIIETLLI
eukprot:9595-Heterococcus_DN1.PRE.2